MFKKICSLVVFLFLTISSFLVGIDYEIQDIGTLQTRESHAIALNNKGEILGWYSIDGSKEGKHFFIRTKDGSFHELPIMEPGSGLAINWQYLTDEGKSYGTFEVNPSTKAVCVWNQQDGIVKLGDLPGKEISAINNAGQVLIKCVTENKDGRSISSPVIWENGKVTRLKGLEGDLGIESEESYGYDMNNKGEVVGQSVVYLSYKNNLYKQIHATLWIDGQAIDLHNEVSKRSESTATVINDLREILIEGQLLHVDGKLVNIGHGVNGKATNTNYLYYKDFGVFDKFGSEIVSPGTISGEISKDFDSIWMVCREVIGVNDNGEVIAQGTTIYGEQHALLLVPVKSN